MKQNKHKGYGAIAGDLLGSHYEFNPISNNNPFMLYHEKSHFTDDTILTIATMDALINNVSCAKKYREWGNKYDGDYYGAKFKKWLKSNNELGNSWGNGASMRISPIGYAVDLYNQEKFLDAIDDSVLCSHNNVEAREAALITAMIIGAFHQDGRDSVREAIDIYSNQVTKTDYYSEEAITKAFIPFTSRSSHTVPISWLLAINCHSVLEAAFICCNIGGDCDTMSSIAGEIICARERGVPDKVAKWVREKLPQDMLDVLDEFNKKF